MKEFVAPSGEAVRSQYETGGNAPAKADFVLSPNLRQCVPAIDICNSHELAL